MKRLLHSAAIIALIPATAFAEDALPIETDEIVVIGGRTPIPADALGRASSVVTSEDIERRQIVEVSEALRALPGVSVSRSGGPGGVTQVRLRGAEANHVLVLIDGVEVSQAQSGEYDFAGLLATDIDRIEVLRGPQSALWGSNATAGVISITTKSGPRNDVTAGGQIEVGSNGTGLVSAFVRGGNEDVTVSVTATARRDGGYDISDSPGGKDDEDRNITLNGRMSYTVTDALTVGGSIRITDRESDFDQFNFGAANRDGLVTDANNFLQQREIFSSGFAKLDSFGGRLSQEVRLNYTDVVSVNFTNAVRSSDVESDRLKVGYQATVALDAPSLSAADHRVTLALEWEREGFENVDPNLVFSPSQLGRQERSLFGIAGEYRGTFFDDLDLQLGLRYDINDDFENALTYSVGVSYMVDETGTRFHGSVGRGVTNPTFFEQFGFIPNNFLGNPDLDPEENFSWDIGVEQAFWDERLVIDVTYFQDRLKNEIVTLSPPPTFTGTPINQTGISRRQGVEIAATLEPLPGLALGASYTWLNTEDPNGTAEVRRPRHEGSVTAAYSFLGGDATVSADARFVLGNLDTDFTAPAFGTARVALDDYVVVNLAASYKLTETVALNARIENVTDTDYEEVDGFATRGITGYAGVRLSF